LTQNGQDSPQNHAKRSQFFSNILCVIHILYILYNSIGSSLKGRCWGGNCPKRPKNGKFCNLIIRPNLFSTVKYALNTIRCIIEYAVRHIPAVNRQICVTPPPLTHTHTHIHTNSHTHTQTHTHTHTRAHRSSASPFSASARFCFHSISNLRSASASAGGACRKDKQSQKRSATHMLNTSHARLHARTHTHMEQQQSA